MIIFLYRSIITEEEPMNQTIPNELIVTLAILSAVLVGQRNNQYIPKSWRMLGTIFGVAVLALFATIFVVEALAPLIQH